MHPNSLEPTALLITKTEAATRLGVGVATINKLIDQGLLDAVRLGYRTVRVRACSVEDLPARLDTTHQLRRQRTDRVVPDRGPEEPGDPGPLRQRRTSADPPTA